RVLFSTREAAGASGARHSLLPSWGSTAPSDLQKAERSTQNSREMRGEIAELCQQLKRRHCEERSDEAIHSCFLVALWIASRSLSSGVHSRDPLARNDGVGTVLAV
ncbi:MAG: hypothetical protein P4M05_16335, partial [Bradyrhizobium sp.]|nr:hypothetical protein [Bradyrhizobium sp.]